MKTKKLKAVIVLILALIVAALTFTACGGNGNGDASDNAKAAIETVKDISGGAATIPSEATHVTAESTLSQPGNYYVDSSFDGKITVSCDGVTLYLSGANITNNKKVIESTFDMTITLIGNNSVSNSNTAGSNAIDCTGNLVINGSGSLSVDATKNGIKAKSISVIDATLDIKAGKDGLHAEIDAYDEATVAPSPAYKDGGFVYLKNAKVINTIGFSVAEEVGVKYLPSDFKKRGGYLHSVRLSEEYGLYRQDYCGCAFSKAEREKQKQK